MRIKAKMVELRSEIVMSLSAKSAIALIENVEHRKIKPMISICFRLLSSP